jgi:hypothetical protein
MRLNTSLTTVVKEMCAKRLSLLIIVGVIDVLECYYSACFQCSAFDVLEIRLCVTAAAKQTAATRHCSKKALEEGLANWFGNARDRGEGGSKNTRAEKENHRLESE